LAQLLQLEFDKEYDETLKQREKQRNKHSRVAVSYDKFKSVHPAIAKDEQHFDLLTQKELSSATESEDEICSIKFKNGIHGKGENMISKHDKELTGRHNAQKVMNFPPEFETGDSHGINMCLSNQVFNTLKLHSLSEQKRSNRTADKQDRSTNEMSLDKKTRLILFKLVNVSILNSIGGIISTGKEATVFYAAGGDTNDLLVPKECVAKVFKTTLNEFKTREKYIADDYRFKDRFKHLNPQKIIKLWAEKEMHNLMKMRKNDIPCPDPVLLKKHVLIMSFIGSDSVPAPKLKDAILSKDELKSAYEQSVKIIKDLYTRCNLVHADFNQFNLLWFQNSVWVIDVSQSVEPIHPMGLEFLLRDCTNIIKV
jgi:RIO kinase 3